MELMLFSTIVGLIIGILTVELVSRTAIEGLGLRRRFSAQRDRTGPRQAEWGGPRFHLTKKFIEL